MNIIHVWIHHNEIQIEIRSLYAEFSFYARDIQEVISVILTLNSELIYRVFIHERIES